MSMLFGIAMMLGAVAEQVLVQTDALGDLPKVQPVDARDLDAFTEAHLPGALHLDVDELSETREGTVGLLKPREELYRQLGAAGLDPRRPIVVYSSLEKSSDLKQATRLFWILEYLGFSEVHLLDGGLRKWRAEGRPVATGAPTEVPVEVAAYKHLTIKEQRHASREEVLNMQSSKQGIIVDLRSDALFRGESKKDFIARSGHIAGAESRPAPGFVEDEGYTFKGPEVIRELLDATHTASDTPVVTYCNTGRDATIGYVAYRIAGFKEVAVYDGSMAEWGNDTTCPMTTPKE